MLKQLESILKSEIDPAFAQRAGFIFEELENVKPDKILDAGCGRGFYISACSTVPFIKEIHGIDINPAYVARAQRTCPDPRVKIQKASIYELPYPDNYFDFIIASEILEHLDDDEKGLLELRRVLKKDGVLAITVPHEDFPFLWDPINWILMTFFNTHIRKDIWWLAGIWADHERLYTRMSLHTLVHNADFHIQQEKGLLSYCWPFSHLLLYGIGKNIVERLHVSGFDRFNVSDPKPLSVFLANLFSLPSRLLDAKLPSERSMNLVMSLRK